ncbi:MAG: DUF2508 family protein [Bacillota bacterium]|nr:DUF2508 family protein [Candidatus Fermentithermobacillaceae bacterium]
MQLFDLFSRKQGAQDTETAQLLRALRQAQKDYDVAVSCFREATEADRVDEAIFLMEAARKKYSYYLRKLREHTEETDQSMSR